ncbi:FecR domain-containing protein [Pseudomonadales bacterium]|nr:FecR domain-containing protein [Pseudomonadales bacterium]MDB2449814.1 FecR domain-containing protein [Pseudomonadales bacterium]MDC6448577.1 FecR domain-containing protein [Pseudomonadales bacterium]
MSIKNIMKLAKLTTAGILALLLIAGPLSSAAQASVGRVLFKYGNVTVDSVNARLLRQGATVDEGDVIVTGPKGYVQLLLDDGTKIAIRPNSSFEIEALEMPATATAPAVGAGITLKASFKLQKGGFRTLTGRIAQQDPSVYQVTTPAAIIGVRGTNYSTRLCAGDCGSGDDGLYVGVSEGAATLTNSAGELDIPKNAYGFAENFNTPPQRLLSPPASLQEEGSISLEASDDDEEGSDDGDAEDSDAEDSGSDDEGSTEEGSTEEGSTEEGSTEEGSTEESSPSRSDADAGADSNASGEGGADQSGADDGGQVDGSAGAAYEEVASEFGGGTPPVPAAPATGSVTANTTTAPEEPEREIVAEGAGGQVVDITDGQNVVTRTAGLALSVGGVASGINTDFDQVAFDEDNNLARFSDVDSSDATVIYDVGSASITNTGFDSTGSLRWGRWTAGTGTLDSDTTTSDIDLTESSLHWVIAPLSTNPDRVITGSAEYVLVGNTDPTDDLGNRGVLGSASLLADFTNSIVESDVQLGIAGEVWTASGSGAITSNLFNGLYSTVTVNGSSGASGSFGGVFSDSASGVPGAAGLSYQLTNSSRTVSGAAVFNTTSAGSAVNTSQ